jgi:hypothetical protein
MLFLVMLLGQSGPMAFCGHVMGIFLAFCPEKHKQPGQKNGPQPTAIYLFYFNINHGILQALGIFIRSVKKPENRMKYGQSRTSGECGYCEKKFRPEKCRR